MSDLRSAIVVTLPIPDVLEAIRLRHVPVARLGVPPHVTIMSPFKPAGAIDEAVRAVVASIAARETAFEVWFAGLGRFPGFLWAAPDPAAPFLRLTRNVLERYPDDHPFGGNFSADDWVPHLTLAAGKEDEVDQLQREVDATGALPFRAHVTALDVLVETDAGRWKRSWRLSLRR